MGYDNFGKKGWLPERIENISDKTFLITGANTGAGFEASKILLRKGAEVVMLNRNDDKSKKAIYELKNEIGENIKVSYIKLDLADFESVKLAAEEINNSIVKIDALICNAAVAQIAKQTFTKDGFESHLGINHYGHFLLVNLLLNKIEESKGRIVTVESEGYKMGLKKIQFNDMNFDKNYNPMKTYCHSKLAQMIFSYDLQNRIKQANKSTKVYVCHPGASKTTLIRETASKKDRILFSIMAKFPIVQSAEQGSYPEVMCATEPNLKQEAYYGPTGRMQWKGPVGECNMESFVKDKSVMEKLWEESEKQTGKKFEI